MKPLGASIWKNQNALLIISYHVINHSIKYHINPYHISGYFIGWHIKMDKGHQCSLNDQNHHEPRHLFGALLQTPGENTGVMFGGKQTARIFSVRQRPHHLTPKHLQNTFRLCEVS